MTEPNYKFERYGNLLVPVRQKLASYQGPSRNDIINEKYPLPRGILVGEAIRELVLQKKQPEVPLIMEVDEDEDGHIAPTLSDINIGIKIGLGADRRSLQVASLRNHLETGIVLSGDSSEDTRDYLVVVTESYIGTPNGGEYTPQEIVWLTSDNPEVCDQFPIPQKAVRFCIDYASLPA